MIHGASRKNASYVILTGFIIVFFALSFFAVNRPAHAQQQYVTCSGTYTVQPGDDLYQISVNFGVTIAALQYANNIPNANLIYVGQILCIPNGTTYVGTPHPFPDHGYPVTATPSSYNYPYSNNNTVADIGAEPAVNAIGNFLEVCGDCSSTDINATQRQYRQNTLVCASIKPGPNSGEFSWYRVNSYWCGWYPSF